MTNQAQEILKALKANSEISNGELVEMGLGNSEYEVDFIRIQLEINGYV